MEQAINQKREHQQCSLDDPHAYIKLTCPRKSCKATLTLTCPHCSKGALRCDEKSSILHCLSCGQALHGMNCHCGFTIRAPYIMEKQKKLKQYDEQIDPAGYKMILFIFGFLGVVGAVLSAF